MVVKVTYYHMYSSSPLVMEGWVRLPEPIRRPTKAQLQCVLSDDEDSAFYFDGFSEAAALIPMIEEWANKFELVIENIAIVRMGG